MKPQSTSAGQALRDVYLARQAIYDRKQAVVAYEILYRGSADNRAVIEDPNRATAELLQNAFIEIGLERIVGTLQAFVNVTREFLVGFFPLPPEADRLVLEMPDDLIVDDELVAGVGALVDQGYKLALPDVIAREGHSSLLEIASVVKVDLSKMRREELPARVESLHRFPVRLLAEKVETRDAFDFCQSLGFEMFQGYFRSRPEMVKVRQQRANQTTVLRILSRLRDPELSITELEHLVGSDPALAYKLLRYINSSKFSLRYRINSLRQVVLLLGIQKIQNLAMLILLAGVFQEPNEALENAMIRAFFCERLADLSHDRDPHTFFTAGLLSGLGAILGVPLIDVVDSLQLSQELREAVLNHTGTVGQAVRAAIAHELCDWPHMGFAGLEPATVRGAYLSAINETRAMWKNLLE